MWTDVDFAGWASFCRKEERIDNMVSLQIPFFAMKAAMRFTEQAYCPTPYSPKSKSSDSRISTALHQLSAQLHRCIHLNSPRPVSASVGPIDPRMTRRRSRTSARTWTTPNDSVSLNDSVFAQLRVVKPQRRTPRPRRPTRRVRARPPKRFRGDLAKPGPGMDTEGFA